MRGTAVGAHVVSMITRFLIAAAVAIAVTVGIGALGGTKALGAHPFWAMQVTLIGAPIGVVLAEFGALRLSHVTGGILFGLLTAAAWAVAHYGKTAFAASYAEDRFAGQLWYLGWIGVAVFFAAMLASMLRARRNAT